MQPAHLALSDVIHPSQIRAARALLHISQSSLAELSGIGLATIKRLEIAPDGLRGNVRTFLRIQAALELKGVVFIDEDGIYGPGVRFKKPSP